MLCGDMHGGGRSLTAAWLVPQPMNTSYSVWPWRSVAGGYTVDARWLIRRRRRDRPGRQSFTATLTPRFAGALAQTSSQGNVFLVFAMQQTESMWNSKTVMQVVRQRWTGRNPKLTSVAHHKDMNAVCKTYIFRVMCSVYTCMKTHNSAALQQYFVYNNAAGKIHILVSTTKKKCLNGSQ